MEALGAARLGDQVGHGVGVLGMALGALAGVAVGLAVFAVAPIALAGGAAVLMNTAIIGASVAGGAIAAHELVKGIKTLAHWPDPPTGALSFGSINVNINDRSAIRASLDSTVTCTGGYGIYFSHPPFSGLVAAGSETVRVNNLPAARITMPMTCGAKIISASEDVRIGGPTEFTNTVWDIAGGAELLLGVMGALAIGGAVVAATWGGVVAGGLVGGMIGFGETAGSITLFAAAFESIALVGEMLGGEGGRDLALGLAGLALLLGIWAKHPKSPEQKFINDVLGPTSAKETQRIVDRMRKTGLSEAEEKKLSKDLLEKIKEKLRAREELRKEREKRSQDKEREKQQQDEEQNRSDSQRSESNGEPSPPPAFDMEPALDTPKEEYEKLLYYIDEDGVLHPIYRMSRDRGDLESLSANDDGYPGFAEKKQRLLEQEAEYEQLRQELREQEKADYEESRKKAQEERENYKRDNEGYDDPPEVSTPIDSPPDLYKDGTMKRRGEEFLEGLEESGRILPSQTPNEFYIDENGIPTIISNNPVKHAMLLDALKAEMHRMFKEKTDAYDYTPDDLYQGDRYGNLYPYSQHWKPVKKPVYYKDADGVFRPLGDLGEAETMDVGNSPILSTNDPRYKGRNDIPANDGRYPSETE